MKLWITAIALALLSACSSSASLLGSWRVGTANGSQTLEFNADGSYSASNTATNADTQCVLESAYESTYEATATTLTMQPPSTVRDRVTGCANTAMDHGWQSSLIDVRPRAVPIAYRVEDATLVLGSMPNTTTYARTE